MFLKGIVKHRHLICFILWVVTLIYIIIDWKLISHQYGTKQQWIASFTWAWITGVIFYALNHDYILYGGNKPEHENKLYTKDITKDIVDLHDLQYIIHNTNNGLIKHVDKFANGEIDEATLQNYLNNIQTVNKDRINKWFELRREAKKQDVK